MNKGPALSSLLESPRIPPKKGGKP